MTYCKTCKIKYNTPIEKCLFCNNKLIVTTEMQSKVKYKYPEVKGRDSSHIFIRMVIFLIIVANIACFAIDIMDSEPIRLSWSLYSFVSSIYLLLVIQYARRHSSFFNKFYCILILTFLEVTVIGLLSPNYHWAVDYIIPWGIITLNIFSILMTIGRKSKLFQYAIYVFGTSVLGFVPLVLTALKVTETTWPSLTCYMYSIVSLLGLLFFSSKETKEELIRRLHL
ncbi:MAG TPA: DUF6320 domain-containing protein [Lachnospiraceae bacterium]|nr:DUF6320 domain-containing protein [Lachnospiraceae bacterium]